VEIDSPPFPKSSANPTQMYWTLSELYDWATDQKAWANMEAARLHAPQQPFITEFGPQPSGDPKRFLNLAVSDMFVSWRAMRAIREKYDEIVRNYEDEESWTSDACIFHRISIVKMSALLLSMAFLDREKREAKEMEISKQARKAFFTSLKKVFGKQGFFDGEEDNANGKRGFFDEAEDNTDEIDFDALFNPPEED
jgi:hypothetical protein